MRRLATVIDWIYISLLSNITAAKPYFSAGWGVLEIYCAERLFIKKLIWNYFYFWVSCYCNIALRLRSVWIYTRRDACIILNKSTGDIEIVYIIEGNNVVPVLIVYISVTSGLCCKSEIIVDKLPCFSKNIHICVWVIHSDHRSSVGCWVKDYLSAGLGCGNCEVGVCLGTWKNHKQIPCLLVWTNICCNFQGFSVQVKGDFSRIANCDFGIPLLLILIAPIARNLLFVIYVVFENNKLIGWVCLVRGGFKSFFKLSKVSYIGCVFVNRMIVRCRNSKYWCPEHQYDKCYDSQKFFLFVHKFPSF